MKLLHQIFQRRKQSRLARKPEGFAIAPILYLLGLIGVGAGVLFSGYSQILRSNQTMSNTMATKNDLQGTATTLAASSWMATDGQTLCPPMIGSGPPSANCTGAAGAIYVGTSFANATSTNLPANYNSVTGTGSVEEVGVFKAGTGAKVLDPWGHYYVYCRWENKVGANTALMVISGGANGKIETTCASTVAGGDDLFVVWTTAVTQNRASVWQSTTVGTTVTGVQYGATGSQMTIDTSGDVSIPGTLSVTGATTLGTNGLAVTGATHLTGSLSATSGTFSSSLGVTGTTTLNGLSAGTSVLTSLSAGNTSLSGTLGVSGAASLGAVSAGSSVLNSLTVNGTTFLGGNTSTSTGVVSIGTTMVTGGSSTPLLTVGKPISNVYPFYVDQNGVAWGSFNGSLSGSQSGGSVSATSLAASGATTLGGTLAVTGATTLTGAFTSNSTATATFAGAVTATNFNGNITIGSGGSGVSFTGVIPIANGGTGASTSSSALSNLLSGNSVPAANIACCIQTSQLSATGVATGTYSSVTVGTDGRVISGVATASSATQISDGSGDSVTVGTSGGIVYTIGSSVQGNWTGTGLMVGSSKAALDKLDVYGGVAIGTGYAGVTAAPTNGLIVQGQVAIGTNVANGALNVNGTVTATGFSGSGAGLTNIGTSSLSGTVGNGNGGTGTNTVFTQGSVVYAGASGVYSQDNSNFFYDATNHRLGIGTAAPQTGFAVNGTASFMFGADYITTGNQSDVNLGAASSVRYNGGAVATFYGIVAGKNGQIIHVHNASSYVLTMSNLSSSETTTNNQIITGTGSDLPLQSNSSVILQYDSTALKWRVIGGSGGGGQGLAGQAAYFQSTGSTVVGTSSIYIVNGNVGIGTANPQNLLHVNGALHMTGLTGGTGVTVGTAVVAGSNGYVQFNSGGNFAGDPAFFWDNTDKWLGIGTSTPMSPLQVDGTIQSFNDNGWSSILDTTYGATYYGAFRGFKARGSAAAPAAVQNGDMIISFDGYGHDGTGFNTPAAAMQILSGSTWTSTASSRSGYLTFSTAGAGTLTERMRIDQSGNVGVGATSPAAQLDILSSLTGTTDRSNAISEIRSNGSGRNVTLRLSDSVANSADISMTANRVQLSVNGVASLYYNDSGNVGIGTATPLTALHVIGTATATTFAGSGASLTSIGTSNLGGVSGTPGVTTFLRGDGTWATMASSGVAVGTGNANYVARWTGTSALSTGTLYDNGTTVAIGTASPTAVTLDVEAPTYATEFLKSQDAASYVLQEYIAAGDKLYIGKEGTTAAQLMNGDTANASIITDIGAYPLQFGTNDITRMTISSAGYVGIGTVTPNGPLDVAAIANGGSVFLDSAVNLGTAAQNLNLTFRANNLTNVGQIQMAALSSTAIDMAFSTYNSGMGEKMRITGTGNVGIGTTTPAATMEIQSTAAGLRLESSTSAQNAWIDFYNAFVKKGNLYYNGSYGAMVLNDAGTNTILNTGGGSVGIGTTVPAMTLHVAGGGGFASGFNGMGTGYSNRGLSGGGVEIGYDATNNIGNLVSVKESSAWEPMDYWASSHNFNVNGSSTSTLVVNGSGVTVAGALTQTGGGAVNLSGTAYVASNVLTSTNGGSWFGLEPEQGESPAHGSIVNSGTARLLQFNLASPYTAAFAGNVTDNGETVNGTLSITGSNSLYFSSYGGGWYMADSTWIRSGGSKPVYMSNGYDSGAASGVNCGGGLGNGYTFDVCGTANVASNLTVQGTSTVSGAGQVNGAFSAYGRIYANNALVLGGTGTRTVLYLGGDGDCNHAIFNDSSTPCGLNAPSGSNDSEMINYWGGLTFVARQNSSNVAYFNASGVFTIFNDMYANNYYHNSDRRLKDNIQPAKGLELIDKLNGVTFTWKDGGKASAGVIAQDVQAVLPQAVSKTDKGFLAVNYDALLGPVIEAIKELHTQLLALATKVENIVAELQNHEDRIAKLEAENTKKDAEIKALNERLDKLEAAHH